MVARRVVLSDFQYDVSRVFFPDALPCAWLILSGQSFAWFSLGNYYIIFIILSQSLADPSFGLKDISSVSIFAFNSNTLLTFERRQYLQYRPQILLHCVVE